MTLLPWIWQAPLTNISGKKLWGTTFCWLSENESDDEEIPDLGKTILIEEDIVESSDDSDGEETAINSVAVT